MRKSPKPGIGLGKKVDIFKNRHLLLPANAISHQISISQEKNLNIEKFVLGRDVLFIAIEEIQTKWNIFVK